MNQFSHRRAFPGASFTDVVRPNADTLFDKHVSTDTIGRSQLLWENEMRTKIDKRILALTVALLTAVSSQVFAQDRLEMAAKNPKAFLELMTKKFKWNEPAEPMKVAGPIYFVGDQRSQCLAHNDFRGAYFAQ